MISFHFHALLPEMCMEVRKRVRGSTRCMLTMTCKAEAAIGNGGVRLLACLAYEGDEHAYLRGVLNPPEQKNALGDNELHLFSEAIRGGQLGLVSWFINEYTCRIDWQIVDMAVASGNFELVSFLMREYRYYYYNWLDAAVRTNNISLIKYMMRSRLVDSIHINLSEIGSDEVEASLENINALDWCDAIQYVLSHVNVAVWDLTHMREGVANAVLGSAIHRQWTWSAITEFMDREFHWWYMHVCFDMAISKAFQFKNDDCVWPLWRAGCQIERDQVPFHDFLQNAVTYMGMFASKEMARALLTDDALRGMEINAELREEIRVLKGSL